MPTPGQIKARNLIKYWEHGEGSRLINWGTPGDFTRCVTHLTPYLGPRAKGYCAIRHKHTTGTWPGNHNHQP